MNKEDLRWAINGWIGEKTLKVYNKLDKYDNEAVSLMDFFGLVGVTIFVYSLIGLVISSLILSPIYLITMNPETSMTHTRCRHDESMCELNILELISLIGTIIDAAILAILAILTTTSLQNVGFYSRSMYEERMKSKTKMEKGRKGK